MKNFLIVFVPALAVVAVGVTAAMHGEAADAPGLALIGILLITGSLAAAEVLHGHGRGPCGACRAAAAVGDDHAGPE